MPSSALVLSSVCEDGAGSTKSSFKMSSPFSFSPLINLFMGMYLVM